MLLFPVSTNEMVFDFTLFNQVYCISATDGTENFLDDVSIGHALKDFKKFERRVEKLVDVITTNLLESFRDGVLWACDELCGKNKVKNMGGTKWWWNEEVRNAITRKKEAFKTFCKTELEEHKIFYRKMRNQT